MQIKKLTLKNFRNYEKLELSFNKNINIIIGDNGVGKTNIIESIFILALTKSFRTSNDKNLIKEGCFATTIEGDVFDKKLKNYKFLLNREGKKVEINKFKINRLSDYISNINVILFHPDDLRIIKDTPIIRRKMLNIELSQLNNRYLQKLNDYNILLKQRNNYLRMMYLNKNIKKDYLQLITEKLMLIGKEIYDERKKFLENINKLIENYYFKITKIHNLKVKYISDYNNYNYENMLKKYEKVQEKDIILGKTSIGIHHDDIKFYLENKDLKEYGSEGQQKNAIIAFKLSEIEYFKKIKQKSPILLLDDLFSELDNNKINNIIKLLRKTTQVIITITDIEKVNKKMLINSKLIKIRKNQVEEYDYGS